MKSGDNLLKIAKANGVKVSALRSANNLKTDQIKVGRKLIIPSKGSAPTAPIETGAIPVSPTPAGTNP